jgi:Secretion system C-terminal sorting domain
MKKQLLAVLSFFIIGQSNGQQIKDANFAKAIRGYCPTCLDLANNITEDGQKLTGLTVSIQHLTDITGVAGFSSLVVLNCGTNDLTFLPPLPSRLRVLFVSQNKLTTLGNLPSSLSELYCSDNQLTELPNLPTALRILNCSYNAITALPKMPEQLQTLQCTHNLLMALPILPNTLEGLVCANNNLKYLPNLPKTLSFLGCQNNADLKCLPRLPDSLAYLYVSKDIRCLPNPVKKAVIANYEGIVSQPANLPLCTAFQLPFCPVILPDSSNLDKKIAVFPNPTEGVFTIKHQGSKIQSIWIFNYLGQLVREILNDRTVVDLTDLAAGWYFLRIETNLETVTTKIVKQ